MWGMIATVAVIVVAFLQALLFDQSEAPNWIRYIVWAILGLSVALLLAGCSASTTRLEQRGDGTCVQVRTETLFGVEQVSENVVRCPE